MTGTVSTTPAASVAGSPAVTLPPAHSRLRAALPPLAFGLVVLIIGTAPYWLDAYSLDVLTLGLTYGLMAMALALLIGFTGLPSLGHSAFLGLGAYSAGLLAVHTTDNALVGLVLAAVVGAAAAAVVGALSLRTHGVFFLMLTLAFAEIIRQIAIKSSFTGGDNGLSVPAPHIPLLSSTGLPQVVTVYWYVLAVVAVGYVVLSVVVRSPFGKALVGVRDNPHRMAAIGYSVVTVRLRAVMLSGALTAVGGALLVQKDTLVAPTALTPDASVLLLVMVLVGGARSLTGALVGAVGMVFLRSFTSSWLGEAWLLVEGVLFVSVVYFMPSGLAGLAATVRSRIRRGGPA